MALKMPPMFGELPAKAEAEKHFIPYAQTKANFDARGLGIRKRDMEAAELARAKEAKVATRQHIGDRIREALLARAQEEIATSQRMTLSYDDLDESQKTAVREAVRNQFCVIVGKAGTGKSTSADATVTVLTNINEDLQVHMVSFMGRAVQQIKLRTHVKWHANTTTIHRFLGYHPEWYWNEEKGQETMRFVPEFHKHNKRNDVDVLIIDEAGSVSVDLWNRLYEALPQHVKIILMGDINQLRPVHGHSILGYAMLNWPTFELKHIHRQAAENPIIAAAHKVLEGKFPLQKKDDKRFRMVRIEGADSNEAYAQTLRVLQHMYEQKTFDPYTDILLTPQNKGPIGKDAFNAFLGPHFNKPVKEGNVVINKRQIIHAGGGQHALAQGDKVMFLQNDHASGITNGMIGLITEISINPDYDHKRNAYQKFDASQLDNLDMDKFMAEINEIDIANEVKTDTTVDDESQRAASHVVTVMFEAAEGNVEKVLSTVGALKQISLAYACTVHKSQGGEYPTVVILVHSANHRMLNREMLYTAITRGKNRVVVIYNHRGMTQALNSQMIRGNTLDEKIKCFFELEENIESRMNNGEDVSRVRPYLPKPRVEEVEGLIFEGSREDG